MNERDGRFFCLLFLRVVEPSLWCDSCVIYIPDLPTRVWGNCPRFLDEFSEKESTDLYSHREGQRKGKWAVIYKWMLMIQRRKDNADNLCALFRECLQLFFFFPSRMFFSLSAPTAFKENRAFVSVLISPDWGLPSCWRNQQRKTNKYFMGQPVAFIMTLVALCSCFFY